MVSDTAQRGAFHIVGIVFVLLLFGVLLLLASWSRDVSDLRSQVGGLNQRVHALEKAVDTLQGKVGP